MILYFFKMSGFLGLMILAMAVMMPHAYSQNSQFPEFSLSDELEERIIESDVRPGKSITIRRPLTRDILLLQEQINILQALIERQSEIKKIAENYDKIGLPFLQPSPSLSTCQKLPLNVLCLYAYPDLNGHSDVIETSAIRFQEKQNQAMVEAIEAMAAQIEANNSNFSSPNIADIPAEMIENIEPEQAEYVWADIQCIQTNCTALLVSTLDSNNRFRVANNEQINEYIKIINITPTRITARIYDETSTIRPMALEGKKQVRAKLKPIPAVNKPQPEVAAILDDNIKNNTAFQTPAIDAIDSQNSAIPMPTPTTTDQPLLGPTGLF